MGFSASLLHGGGLKNIVLGEVLACGIFGPLSILFAYIEQVGSTDHQLSYLWIAVYSLPFVLFTEAIFHRYETTCRFVYFYLMREHYFPFVFCLSHRKIK